MTRFMKILTSTALLGSVAISTGCAQVSPWERGTLSKPEMAFNYDKTSVAVHQHIYFSKEAASGGYGTGGGGCGCN